jgi:predicted PurR-regulated permease PerM
VTDAPEGDDTTERPERDDRSPTADPAVAAPLGTPGKPFDRRAPYMVGLLAGLGLLSAWMIGHVVMQVAGILVEIVVALFIAAGLDPLVRFFERRGMRRSYAVLVVIVLVLAVLALFLVAFVPVISDQVSSITKSAPGWLDELQHNHTVQKLNDDYHVIDKIKAFITGGDFAKKAFGGVVGFGLAVLGALLNAFVVTVLTLYFLAAFQRTKRSLYRLAPASRRERVTALGDRIFDSVGGYVSGAFVIALCAGFSSLVFLFIVGEGQYAIALAFVVMITDVIPMIGATIGAVIVCAICFADSVHTGLIAIVFYIVYQQLENYVIYPRVMSKSVDIPGVVTVIAALVGASLLGVVGALLAIPTAAAILMIVEEVWIRAQDQR